MKRQIIAFLSLFSLVLVLSIYYVVSPMQNESLPVSKDHVEVEELSKENYYFSSYALAREEKHQEIIDEQVALIASNDITSEEVVLAKEVMQKEEEIMALEEALEIEVTSKCNFVASYVEIMDTYYNIFAYRPNMVEEEELLAVDSIFQTTDTYFLENQITWMKRLDPVIEFHY